MNKNFYIPLCILSVMLSMTAFAVTSQDSIHATEKSNPDSSIGQKWIKELVKAYNEGRFQKRLAVINNTVQKGIEEGTFDKYEASIKEEKEASNTPEAKKEMEELTIRLESFRQKSSELIEETNKAMTQVLNAYPASEIAKSIKISNEIISSSGIEKYFALQETEKILGLNGNAPYPQFNEIAHKYELKHTAIMLLQANDFEMIEGSILGFPTESSADQHEIDSILIRYEEFLEAFKIAQDQADDSLVILITQAINEYFELRGAMHDIKYLNSLGKRSVLPQDEAEKQVAEIMSSYQAKQKALIQEYFPMRTVVGEL